MSNSIDMIEIEVEVLASNDKAIRVCDGDVTDWIPLSLIELITYKNAKIAEITIPEWLAKEKGFI